MSVEGGMGARTFIGVIVVVAALAVVFGVWLQAPGATGCDALDEAPAIGTQPDGRALTIEFIGNTEAHLRDVRRFVTSELAKEPVHRPLAVAIVLVVDGSASSDLQVDCLKRTLVLQGSEDDMASYEAASEGTKRQLDEGFSQARAEQSKWVATAVSAELDALKVSDPDSIGVSVPSLWRATKPAVESLSTLVEGPPSLSVLAPFSSTKKDCLDATTLADEEAVLGSTVLIENVDALVSSCVETGSIPKLDVGPSALVPYGGGDQAFADAVIAGMCRHAVSAGCEASEGP